MLPLFLAQVQTTQNYLYSIYSLEQDNRKKALQTTQKKRL